MLAIFTHSEPPYGTVTNSQLGSDFVCTPAPRPLGRCGQNRRQRKKCASSFKGRKDEEMNFRLKATKIEGNEKMNFRLNIQPKGVLLILVGNSNEYSSFRRLPTINFWLLATINGFRRVWPAARRHFTLGKDGTICYCVFGLLRPFAQAKVMTYYSTPWTACRDQFLIGVMCVALEGYGRWPGGILRSGKK